MTDNIFRCDNCLMGEAAYLLRFDDEEYSLCGCCNNAIRMEMRRMRKDGCYGCETCEDK